MTEGALKRRVRLDLAYRGSAFHGFAANPDVRSVEGSLADALGRVLRHDVKLFVAGRTDRGVHAAGQVVSFDTVAPHFNAAKLCKALNKLLAPDIVIRDVQETDPEFHARFSATGRRYRYRLLESETPDPQRLDVVWWVPAPVSLVELDRLAPLVVGAHDFSGFCRRPKGQPDASLIRRVFDASWERVNDELHFVILANAFCTQMVRSIVGTSVEIARGRVRPDLIEELLETGDRSLAPEIAPPQGLTLTEVTY